MELKTYVAILYAPEDRSLALELARRAVGNQEVALLPPEGLEPAVDLGQQLELAALARLKTSARLWCIAPDGDGTRYTEAAHVSMRDEVNRWRRIRKRPAQMLTPEEWGIGPEPGTPRHCPACGGPCAHPHLQRCACGSHLTPSDVVCTPCVLRARGVA